MVKTKDDYIGEERAASTPDPEWSVTRRVRWTLLHGERLTVDDLVSRFGLEPKSTLLSIIGKDLDERGIPVVRDRDSETRAVTYSVSANGQAPRPRSKAEPVTRPGTAMPTLGAKLTVSMLCLTPEGYGLALRSDNGHEWLAHIDVTGRG